MLLGNFFGRSHCDVKPVPFEEQFTEVRIPERNKDGSVTITTKVLEAVVDPLATLKFSDFSLNAMLAAGVAPKSIHLTPDIRIGSDKELKEFNARVDELAEKMFNSKS